MTNIAATVRRLSFLLRWYALGWPCAQVARRCRPRRGRTFLYRRCIGPFSPPAGMTFVHYLPGGGQIKLGYRETLGVATLLDGHFERQETRTLIDLARPGTTAIDVGANIGIHTVPLARAVGPTGGVLAFEPQSDNTHRLAQTIALNGLTNVAVRAIALGAEPGTASLHLSQDPAFHSTVAAAPGRDTGQSLTVPRRRLDDIWRQAGAPAVSVLKIDVEGAELDVLTGGQELLASCTPAVLVEANTNEAFGAIERWMNARGYVAVDCPGFQPWNFLFTRS